MRKLITIFIALHTSLLAVHPVSAQWGCTCLPEGITFTEQSQIDAFQVNYPGCQKIRGDVAISGSDIISLEALAVLKEIDGRLLIENNPALTCLAGLENINPASLKGLKLINNQMLCSCEIQNICEFMTNPCGNVEIRQNAPGCSGPAELAGNCGITLNCRDFPDYFFSSQGEIDSFPVSFPDCSQLNGRIVICGDEIKDLRGLRGLSFINGDLSICNNKSLCNLTGLDNIYSIMGELKIYGNNSLQSLKGLDQLNYTWSDVCIGLSYLGNPILKSLTGLRNLNVIGGDLKISGNDSLSSLEGLDQLFSLWGQLVIVNNDALVSLAGIDNLDAGSISYLWIHNNYSLVQCDVQSICNYLAGPGSYVSIYGNAPGCNSKEEVEAACEAVGVELGGQSSKFKVCCYPNPTCGIVNLQFTVYNLESFNLKIFNAQGQEVATVFDGRWPGGQVVRWDASGLPAGIYYYRLTANDQRPTTGTGKIVKY